MPGEGFAAVATRDGKVEHVVEGRVHAFVGHRPSPCRLVVGPCDLISEKDEGRAAREKKVEATRGQDLEGIEGKLTFENGVWTTLRVAGLVVLVQGYGGVGEVGVPLGEDVHTDGVIDVMGIILGRSWCPWLEELACLNRCRQDGKDRRCQCQCHYNAKYTLELAEGLSLYSSVDSRVKDYRARVMRVP